MMLAEQQLLAGRYTYQRDLGRGAGGRVILALDRSSQDEPRAIKLVTPDQQERLSLEFALLSSISHPNLARVHELLRVDGGSGAFELPPGTVALVSEYAPGLSAADRAREQARDPRALLRLALGVGHGAARALSAIHARGVVHGDVKPANVIVADDGSITLW